MGRPEGVPPTISSPNAATCQACGRRFQPPYRATGTMKCPLCGTPTKIRSK